MRPPVRLIVSVVIGAALAALIAFAQTHPSNAPSAGVAGMEIGNDFEDLIDQDGRALAPETFAGKYQLVFFGFTHCPSVCPAELLRFKTLRAQLSPAQREKLAFIFVSVDPARDTPAVMKDYVNAFDPAITGLTGPAGAVKKTIAAWKVYAATVDLGDGDYTVDHSAHVYFRDPGGRLLGLFDDEPAPEMAAAIRAQIPD